MALKKIDTVLLKRKTGQDAFANNIYSDQEQFAGRFNDEVKTVTDEKGIEFVSIATIYYDNETTLNIGDCVKLDGSDIDFKTIRAIAKYRNGSGTRFFNIAYLSESIR